MMRILISTLIIAISCTTVYAEDWKPYAPLMYYDANSIRELSCCPGLYEIMTKRENVDLPTNVKYATKPKSKKGYTMEKHRVNCHSKTFSLLHVLILDNENRLLLIEKGDVDTLDIPVPPKSNFEKLYNFICTRQ